MLPEDGPSEPMPNTGIITRRVAMKNLFNRFVREEQGQDLIEYALLAGLISLASVLAITSLGSAIRGHFTAAGVAVVAATP
jgi:pilus assembly protein Flp/PilA